MDEGFRNHLRIPDVALDLRSQRCALVAAEQGSFRRAAAELGLQQSTISRRIQWLEHRLGAAIFDRHRSGVRLTSAGDRFCERLQRATIIFTAHFKHSHRSRVAIVADCGSGYSSPWPPAFSSGLPTSRYKFRRQTVIRTAVSACKPRRW
jgi:DNA-binding transcriptional LysR family regulator